MTDRGRPGRRPARNAAAGACRPPEPFVVGPIVADLRNGQATRDGRLLRLRRRQFDLLVYLMRHADEVVTREMLARHVWRDETAMWTNVITVSVHCLRRELERAGCPTVLHTVRGRGYRLGTHGDGESSSFDGEAVAGPAR